MSLKDDFVQSFVKGLGKTTGIFMTAGVAMGVWYLGSYWTAYFTKQRFQPPPPPPRPSYREDMSLIEELDEAMNDTLNAPTPTQSENVYKEIFDRYF